MENQDHPLRSSNRRSVSPAAKRCCRSARSPDECLCFVSRRHALAAVAFGFAALAGAPAIAEGDIYVHAGANFKPVTIAVTPFAGEEAGDKISGVVASDFARSIFLLPLNPASFPETIANPDAAPNMEAWKTAAAQFVLTGRVLHQDAGARHRAIPFVGYGDRRAGRRPAIFDRRRERAPRRAHDRRRGVLARDRREGIFRFPDRLRRRDRPEGEAAQAARGHGHGRRERQISRRRQRACRHPALLAFRPASRLHVVRRRRPQGDAAQSRDRTARVGRQFSRHDLRAALLAGRTSRS